MPQSPMTAQSSPMGRFSAVPVRQAKNRMISGAVYKSLYSFKNTWDGSSPQGALIAVKGVLYGTTFFGGGFGCADGCGTVYSITTLGKERVLYALGYANGDGAYPSGDLVLIGGKLYGTTQNTVAYSSFPACCGTVFEIDTSGHEKVLHEFGGSSDGRTPYGGLVAINKELYGTTLIGGNACYYYGYSCGTVFRISTSGEESVLYSFGRASHDGEYPTAPVTPLKGWLYGTTGGDWLDYEGGGTVFKVSRTGEGVVL